MKMDYNGLTQIFYKEFKIITTDNIKAANRLVTFFWLFEIKPCFLIKYGGKITTRLEFGRFWGLGTSSTLIANLAKWSNEIPIFY